MFIPSPKYLKKKADNRMASGKDPQKVVLVYAAITLASSLVITIVRYLLANEISQTGGLHNIGLRSVLSTADNLLPILHAVLIMCMELGYAAAMLRIARRQYASPKTLKAGVERFGPLLRSRLLQSFLYFGAFFMAFYASIAIFMLSPFSRAFSELTAPLVASGNFSPEMLMQDEALMGTLMDSILPVLIIYAVVVLLMAAPIFYRYRFVNFVLADHPEFGAMQAMRESKRLMFRNMLNMIKIDLSFWWYYLLQIIASTVIYLDVILSLCGISLPVSDAVNFFGSFLLYVILEFVIFYYLKNKVTVTYALAYDALIPHEKPEGLVLGNIFNM